MRILVTGGAGYIGSHTVRALLDSHHEPVVLDNLDRGHREAVPSGVPFYEMDIRDKEVRTLLQDEKIEGVMHFAAHSQVGESMGHPNIYYENNVLGSFALIESIRQCGSIPVVFSSTAAVYGEPKEVPIAEDSLLEPTNVYGRTKLIIERMLRDYHNAYGMNYIALRYFNAAGAAPDGTIGEDHEPETHLIPLVLQAALGKRPSISVFGADYDTPDGTCIRDYIHVQDLAQAHILAMEYISNNGVSRSFNLGSGKGYSVRQIIDAAKEVTGTDFQVDYEARRAGDPAVLIASTTDAEQTLQWNRQFDLKDIIKDAWAWHKSHPQGF